MVVRRDRERRSGEALVAEWRIKASGLEATPDTLSGGNQQKVVLARNGWRRARACCCSTSRRRAWTSAPSSRSTTWFARVAAEGAACLVVSSDLPEVLALADRILVMREGRLRGELAAAQATEEHVMRLATHEGEAA